MAATTPKVPCPDIIVFCCKCGAYARTEAPQDPEFVMLSCGHTFCVKCCDPTGVQEDGKVVCPNDGKPRKLKPINATLPDNLKALLMSNYTRRLREAYLHDQVIWKRYDALSAILDKEEIPTETMIAEKRKLLQEAIAANELQDMEYLRQKLQSDTDKMDKVISNAVKICRQQEAAKDQPPNKLRVLSGLLNPEDASKSSHGRSSKTVGNESERHAYLLPQRKLIPLPNIGSCYISTPDAVMDTN